jgi:hypothetical protein
MGTALSTAVAAVRSSAASSLYHMEKGLTQLCDALQPRYPGFLEAPEMLYSYLKEKARDLAKPYSVDAPPDYLG